MKTNRSIESIMQDFKLLIWNSADDPLISPRIMAFGFTQEELSRGKTLYLSVEDSMKKQKKEYAEQYAATNQFNAKRDEMEEVFGTIQKHSRYVFDDDQEMWSALELSKKIPQGYAQWFPHVSRFCERLLAKSDAITELVPFGHSEEKITGFISDLEELNQLYLSRQREVGDAQQATKDRDAKFELLKKYCLKLKKLLRLVFVGEDAQYLEKVGIRVRS
ncbi:hypothetical protein DMA11_00505 [Marinilabiliaceae bacterium JC017]|nr:hypothetical protein DMA11_00505 [Marinilabiliaceae bacterium JC017]